MIVFDHRADAVVCKSVFMRYAFETAVLPYIQSSVRRADEDSSPAVLHDGRYSVAGYAHRTVCAEMIESSVFYIPVQSFASRAYP